MHDNDALRHKPLMFRDVLKILKIDAQAIDSTICSPPLGVSAHADPRGSQAPSHPSPAIAPRNRRPPLRLCACKVSTTLVAHCLLLCVGRTASEEQESCCRDHRVCDGGHGMHNQ
eukprot:scaffold140850_cov18-Tisochrysis_lutea.AAC.1